MNEAVTIWNVMMKELRREGGKGEMQEWKRRKAREKNQNEMKSEGNMSR